MGLNFREKLQNRIFAFFISLIREGIKENNYTVGCDIHDYIFTKTIKFSHKIRATKNFRLYGNKT